MVRVFSDTRIADLAVNGMMERKKKLQKIILRYTKKYKTF